MSINGIMERFGDEPLLVGGDFNGRIGLLEEDIPEELLQVSVLCSERVPSDVTKNKEGRVLVEMMSDNCMFVLNGRTPGDCPGQLTYCSHLGSSTIDYFWGNFPALGAIHSLVVWDKIFLADHFPLILKLSLPGFRPELADTDVSTERVIKKIKWNPNKADEFTQALEHLIEAKPEIFGEGIEEINNFLGEAIMKCAMSTDMVSDMILVDNNKQLSSEVNKKSKWFDNEVKESKLTVSKAWRVYKKDNARRRDKESDNFLRMDYQAKKKACKDLIDEKKKLYAKDLRRRIANVKNMNEFWSAVKEVNWKPMSRNPISKEKWEEFFKEA